MKLDHQMDNQTSDFTIGVNRAISTREVLVTSASNEYFPWLVNLIMSTIDNDSFTRKIVVYDLGLSDDAVRELKIFRNVEVRKVPAFAEHWRVCYSWKFYGMVDAPGDLIYYLDSGSMVLKPLEYVFSRIASDGHFCVFDSHLPELCKLSLILPQSLKERVGITESIPTHVKYFLAGNFGFKRGSKYETLVREAHQLAVEGWCIGWSKHEVYRNKRENTKLVISDCELFRHDQSVLNALFFRHFDTIVAHDDNTYGASKLERESNPVVYNCRRNKLVLAYWRRGFFPTDLSPQSRLILKNRVKFLFASAIMPSFVTQQALAIAGKFIKRILSITGIRKY